MGSMLNDLRHTARTLARRPGFTLVVVLTLGFGVGVNIAIFSAVHRLIVSPMPFEDGDRLAFVWRESRDNAMLVTPSPEVASRWLDARSFEAALYTTGERILADGGQPARVGVSEITPNLPDLLRVRPLVGRAFTAEDARTDGAVALISEGLWRTRFGARRDVAGASIRLDERVVVIVGVMPDRFAAFDGTDGNDQVWTPLDPGRSSDAEAGSVGALIRLREGFSMEQASAELDLLAADPDAGADRESSEWRYRAVTPGEFLGSGTRTGLLVLLGSVMFVLLIACANIAALLLVRLDGRRHELSIRSALGASRRRLIGSLAAELAMLATTGAAVGVLLGAWVISAIRVLRPPQVHNLDAIALSTPVVAYGIATALVAAVLFGLAPGLVLLRRDFGSPLRSVSAGGERVTEARRFRSILVTLQVALSVALLVGAALLTRSVAQLRSVDLGFEPEGLVTIEFTLPEARYSSPASIRDFVETMNASLATLPGVLAATDAVGAPPDVGIAFGTLHVEGREPAEQGGALPAAFVGPGLFRILRAPLLEGREFASTDVGTDVVIVDETFARENWPGESAVGRRFRLSAEGAWSTVIGVAPGMAVNGPAGRRDRVLYYPNGRNWANQSFVVRVAGADALAIAPHVREVVRRIDPGLPVTSMETVVDQLEASIAGQRFFMLLLGTFAVLALVLSAIGLYGVVAYALARRTREIGVRLALGAAPRQVRDMLLADGARIAAAGVTAGVVAAWAGARVLGGMLHGVEPRDPLAFGAAVLVSVAVTLLASWIPARRATRVAPLTALRSE